ncbi:hypothetical protein GE09DRAFT_1173007 [Coniochaeta sp. 2T2.1]|nr:hypothetical protein GE09DRAFT_1173007 [Coniochaeta sp. 2T2.1]
MDDEIAELRKALQEEQRRREEEQRRREEEQRRREEEQRRREEAEALAEASQPQALQPYLGLCHSLNLSIQVLTDRSSTTQGDTTTPTEEIWNHVSKSQLFCSQPAFPSQHQLEYVKSLLKPISSEIGLRDFERDVVENAVQKLGTVTFESHTNLGDPTEPMELMSVGSDGGGERYQFCIHRRSDGRRCPALAIEYKAPHKLSVDEVYGYICTGQAFVFLHVPANPATVYYHVSVPNQDVLVDDELRLHRTAVAQVFAFILQALRAEPPPQSWHDAAAVLDTWAVEYDDVLRDVPATIRKEARASAYKPQRWKGCKRSPIRTRSHCQQLDANVGRMDDDDENGPPSPSPNPSRSGRKAARSKETKSIVGSQREQRRDPQSQQQQQRGTKTNIQDRPFCTQQCLLGLAHLNRLEFLRLRRAQLAVDRGHEADCTPLHLSGSRGSLFKVRLSSHGYTLVAKGMESLDRAFLQHENNIYDRLQDIQGKHVPVCLGSVDLVRPYYYDRGVYTRFMFLSWAGQPLFDGAYRSSKADVVAAVTSMFKAVHGLRVLHRDAEPRNILYDANSGKLMVVDFERAEFRWRQPLGSMDSNGQNRKRKRGISQKQEKDEFAQELESVVKAVSRCVTH